MTGKEKRTRVRILSGAHKSLWVPQLQHANSSTRIGHVKRSYVPPAPCIGSQPVRGAETCGYERRRRCLSGYPTVTVETRPLSSAVTNDLEILLRSVCEARFHEINV